MVWGGVGARSPPPPPPPVKFRGFVEHSFARFGRTNFKKDNFTNFKALFPALYILAYWPLSKL